jgi:hypothetical protein
MDEVRTFLVAQHEKLRAQIDMLHTHMRVIQGMLDDLPDTFGSGMMGGAVAPKVTPVLTPVLAPVAVEKAPRKSKKRGVYRPRNYEVPTAALVRTALEAAGEEGLTARELANLTDMPTGTASGRLSVMKQQGMVMHITPKYFAVHSQPQDNNQ